MAIASPDSADEAVTGINVTPLVDITLVLLIIFLVTAKTIFARTLPLDLPQASQATSAEVFFRVTMRADGSTLIDGVPVSGDDEVLPRAAHACETSPDVRVVLDIESRVMHGRVAHVLDLLKQARVRHVGFGVAPSRGG
ncbi:MAG TPA: biopolymer transporter ExbD [Polyangiaceae bacterium]|jgi:biopolymer transport protein ExbD